MNYKRIYDDLIDRSKNREIYGYKEKHHIIPRCIGGTDENSNLVYLTPEEHYIAHQLLTKIFPDNDKLIYAAIAMRRARPTNKLYGWLRRKYSKVVSGRQSGNGNSQFGTRWISNLVDRVSKKIGKEDDVPCGWVIGRNAWKKEIISCKECEKEFLKSTRKGGFCSKDCKINYMRKNIECRKYKNGYSVEVDGNKFESISHAADAYGIGHETARMRFKSSNFESWKILVRV